MSGEGSTLNGAMALAFAGAFPAVIVIAIGYGLYKNAQENIGKPPPIIVSDVGPPDSDTLLVFAKRNLTEYVHKQSYPATIKIKKFECNKRAVAEYRCRVKLAYTTTLPPKITRSMEGEMYFLHEESGWTMENEFFSPIWPKTQSTDNGFGYMFPRP